LRVEGFYGLGLRVQDLGFKVLSFRARVQSSGFRVKDFGFQV